MTVSILRTKLHIPPSRSELVSRPRLLERLDGGLDRKLMLVSAPAGFGKTTLLSEWVSQHRDRTAWLSLDKEDNDPVRFWSYLIAALQTVHAGLGHDALQLLQPPQQPATKTILTRLINQVTAAPQGVTLVLDDYHLISDPDIHEGIAFLLEHLPPQMHVVISTRADPPLPIHLVRARGQLTELRSDELRFTASEAAAFLNAAMGLDLAREDAEVLEARTEGWIVGLQLAALSLQGRVDVHEFITTFNGGHHYVLEYLSQEVVRRQPESVQRFLMQTSILDRLYGPLCDAVTGGDDGEAMLAHLLIGDRPVTYRWFAADDLGRMVSTAYQIEEAAGKRLFVHGPEAMTMKEAMERYCRAFHPEVASISVMPVDAARAVARSTGNQMLGFFAELMAYFDQVGELGDPAEANRLLGAPTTTLDAWIEHRQARTE